MKSMYIKVAGVTFEGRQLVLAEMAAGAPVMLKPEPENPFDENAIAIWVADKKAALQIGYVPRDLAAIIAPFIEGESMYGKVHEMTGGFEKWDGSRASLGCVVRVELPDSAPI